MIRINDNSKKGEFVNGTLGHIEYMDDHEMIIMTLDKRIINLKKHKFVLKDGDGEVVASAFNFPVTVAYAITIHKSQGATIDSAVIDLEKLWDSGQAYTALSRLSSPEGLRITGWDKSSIKIDPKVVNFYKTIKR